MGDHPTITSGPSTPTRPSAPSRRPLIIILCVLALLVSGFQRLNQIDHRLSRCFSVQGLTGLLSYLFGNFVEAARRYRAHYETTGEPGGESVSPDYAALVMGDLRLAEEAANQLLQEDPHATEPLLTLAEIALRRGEDARALQWCEQVLKQEIDQFDVLLLASVAHARLGRDGQAIQCLNRALRHDRTETRVTSLLMALETTGQLARRPRAKRPWCLLAHYYRYLRIADHANGHRAIAYAKQAIARDDRRADAWLVLGIVYDKQERRRKALDALLKVIEIDPTHAEALRWAGRIYGKFGDIVREYEMTKRAGEAAPEDSFYVGPLNYLLTEKLGDYHQALTLALKTLARGPQDWLAFARVGWAYRVLGDDTRAVEFYLEAVRLDEREDKPWLGLGDSLQAIGRIDEALAAYQHLTSIYPRWYEPYRQIGKLYHGIRRYNEAIEAHELAWRLGNDDLDDLSSLCGLYHMTSQFQQAVDCFREVLRRDPQEPRALRLLSEAENNLRLQRDAP